MCVCACNKCFKCYQLRDAQGRPNGTKNVRDHLKCSIGSNPAAQVQLNLSQCMMQKPKLSKVDMALLKRKQVHYCVEGYNFSSYLNQSLLCWCRIQEESKIFSQLLTSFRLRSVEHEGLGNLMQTCIDFGAKYVKFDLRETLYKRKAVSQATQSMARQVKGVLVEQLKPMVDHGTVSLCVDVYTDDYRKKSYLEVHVVWINRDYAMQHAALLNSCTHRGYSMEKCKHTFRKFVCFMRIFISYGTITAVFRTVNEYY